MIQKLAELQEKRESDEGYIALGKLAPRLVEELSSEVSGPEYAIVARALLTGGNVERAKTYAQEAAPNQSCRAPTDSSRIYQRMARASRRRLMASALYLPCFYLAMRARSLPSGVRGPGR